MFRLSERVFFYRDVGSVRDVMKAVPMSDFGMPGRHGDAFSQHRGRDGEEAHPDPHMRQLVGTSCSNGPSPFMAAISR